MRESEKQIQILFFSVLQKKKNRIEEFYSIQYYSVLNWSLNRQAMIFKNKNVKMNTNVQKPGCQVIDERFPFIFHLRLH